jgi:hypothetical protein
MAFSSLSGSLTVTQQWTVSNDGPTDSYGDVQQQTTLTKRLAMTLGANVANGVNEIYSKLITIAGGGNTTIDLRSITDVLGTALVFARLKGYAVWNLSTTDDADNGGSASSITVGNATANQNKLNMGAVTHTFEVQNGAIQAYFTPKAAGITVDASSKDVKIVNNDGSNSAKILISFFGADA